MIPETTIPETMTMTMTPETMTTAITTITTTTTDAGTMTTTTTTIPTRTRTDSARTRRQHQVLVRLLRIIGWCKRGCLIKAKSTRSVSSYLGYRPTAAPPDLSNIKSSIDNKNHGYKPAKPNKPPVRVLSVLQKSKQPG